MARFFLIFWMLPPLAACAALEAGRGKDALWASSATGRYDFDWQLSGDQAVAPLQVFDDGHQTWLQFSPGQPLPALFAQTSAGEQPLPYVRRDPYIVLQGKWQSLSFRGGRLKAVAQYRGASSPLHQAPEPARLAAVPDVPQVAPHASELAANDVLAPTVSPVSTDMASGASLASRFHAGPSDDTLRAVLSRWALAAGWTFQPQHWAVDVDIPLAGAAEFPADFKAAVRELLATTELADRPLQPCFYTNQVLRVVSLTQSCDRSAQRPGGLS